jgi:hypothetical protein
LPSISVAFRLDSVVMGSDGWDEKWRCLIDIRLQWFGSMQLLQRKINDELFSGIEAVSVCRRNRPRIAPKPLASSGE